MPQGVTGQESSKWFGIQLATAHKTKTETQIEEPFTSLDSSHMISARAPITPRYHASKIVLFTDFEN
jgi:hypothetical protein